MDEESKFAQALDVIKNGYKAYDKAMDKFFADIGLDSEQKGEVFRKEYKIIPSKGVILVKSVKGRFYAEKTIQLLLGDKQLTSSFEEMVALAGLLRYQLKINHANEEVYDINNHISAVIGKKEFSLKDKSNILLAFTIPEVFILVEAIEKIWNE